MPIFDFHCKDCNNDYQTIISYQKKDSVSCPKCKSKEKVQIFKASTVGPLNSCQSSSGFS